MGKKRCEKGKDRESIKIKDRRRRGNWS